MNLFETTAYAAEGAPPADAEKAPEKDPQKEAEDALKERLKKL